MTKLSALRSQLAGLGRARATVRLLTAWSATGIAAIVALAGVFLLDWLFALEVLPRIVVILLGIVGVVWTYRRFTQPMLGVQETEQDLALLVEKHQEIDSDLVAALQFESPEAATWGSRQLETAVVDYVVSATSAINVFDGFSREQMVRRGSLLGAGLAIVLLLSLIFPRHLSAFVSRLLLGSTHYPTATVIDALLVNSDLVLIDGVRDSQPDDARCAQGRPISLLIRCQGSLPDTGIARLQSTAASDSRTTIDLKRLTIAERQARLATAIEKMKTLAQSDEKLLLPQQKELTGLLVLDAAEVAAQVSKVKLARGLWQHIAATEAAFKAVPAQAEESAIYAGELARLMDNVTYKLFLGDAWTDAATVAMIPLPAIEPQLKITPPAYAKSLEQPIPTGRQLALLEGTRVDITLASINGKTLTEAWMTLRWRDQSQRVVFAKSSDPSKWEIPAGTSTPLTNLREEVRYEIQVIDSDGLSLETPLLGAIRIRPDRPPTGSSQLVHRVVLPSASPVIEYRASDDFGISSIMLEVEVEPKRDEQLVSTESAVDPSSSTEPGKLVPMVKHELVILPAEKPVLSGQLPISGSYPLQLAPYKLGKGDRLKLTLHICDYRGTTEAGLPTGQTIKTDPLVLEISDESGVLAAISEADERSEQRLTDIIKRQLGIGESQ